MGVLQNAVKLMQEYKSKHGWVFNAINADPDSGFEGLELETALKHLPRGAASRAAQGDQGVAQGGLRGEETPRVQVFQGCGGGGGGRRLKAPPATAHGKKKPAPPVSLESVSPLLLM